MNLDDHDQFLFLKLPFCTLGAMTLLGRSNENGVPRTNRYTASTSGCMSARDCKTAKLDSLVFVRDSFWYNRNSSSTFPILCSSKMRSKGIPRGQHGNAGAPSIGYGLNTWTFDSTMG